MLLTGSAAVSYTRQKGEKKEPTDDPLLLDKHSGSSWVSSRIKGGTTTNPQISTKNKKRNAGLATKPPLSTNPKTSSTNPKYKIINRNVKLT
jgi:hypothetical protein